MAKTLFSEVLQIMLYDFYHIKAVDILNSSNGVLEEEASIRSWYTRGYPSKSNFLKLLQSVSKWLDEHIDFVSACDFAKLEALLDKIWKKYNIKQFDWDYSSSPEANTIRLLQYAFDMRTNEETSKETHLDRIQQSKKKFSKLVVFDLDGTLIKGFRYSWTIVFKAVGLSGEEATKLKTDFIEGKISYGEWCDSDCSILKSHGLTFQKVEETVRNSGATLTKNFDAAIKKLKANGCKVAIISGGADSVLYAMIPNADQIFDDIYINRLEYNKGTQILEKIHPTPYDWDSNCKGVEGKLAGLKLLCTKYGIDLANSVFVGDDRNDFVAMGQAGMKIYYYTWSKYDQTRGTGIESYGRPLPQDIIFEQSNDLMKVANRVIHWDFGDAVAADDVD